MNNYIVKILLNSKSYNYSSRLDVPEMLQFLTQLLLRATLTFYKTYITTDFPSTNLQHLPLHTNASTFSFGCVQLIVHGRPKYVASPVTTPTNPFTTTSTNTILLVVRDGEEIRFLPRRGKTMSRAPYGTLYLKVRYNLDIYYILKRFFAIQKQSHYLKI